MNNIHNSRYPLWVRSIFASYLPEDAMESYITDLCKSHLAEANDVEKILLFRELEIIQRQRHTLFPYLTSWVISDQ